MSENDYESMTKDELHDLLAERGLPVSGTKDELVARLVEDDGPVERVAAGRVAGAPVAAGHNVVVGASDPDAVDAAQA